MNKSKEKLYPIKIDGLNSSEDREYFHSHLLKATDILTDRMKKDNRQEYLEAIYFLNEIQESFSPHNEDLPDIVVDDVKCAWDLQLYNRGLTTAISFIIGTNQGEDKVDVYDTIYCLSKLNRAFAFTWEVFNNPKRLSA